MAAILAIAGVLGACAPSDGLRTLDWEERPRPGDANGESDESDSGEGQGEAGDSGPTGEPPDTGTPAVADTGSGPCTPVSAPAATSSEVFSRAGVLIAEATSSFPAGVYGPILADAGISWVAVQIVNGTSVQERDAWNAWIADWRCYVPYAGAWGVNGTDPSGEGALAAELLASADFDFYIADAEYEYKYSQDTGYCGTCFERTGAWIDAFESAMASYGLQDQARAVTSYGRVDMADIDWRAWSEAGFHFLPQAYWNESEIYQPWYCVDAATRWVRPQMETTAFFSADRVHPMLGIWGSGSRGYVTADQYRQDLASAQSVYGQIGFSVFRGDMTPSDEWPVLGKAVGQGLAR